MQPETAEPGRMQRFVNALLRHEDALVEPIEPEGLEVLAPPPVQQAPARRRPLAPDAEKSPRHAQCPSLTHPVPESRPPD